MSLRTNIVMIIVILHFWFKIGAEVVYLVVFVDCICRRRLMKKVICFPSLLMLKKVSDYYMATYLLVGFSCQIDFGPLILFVFFSFAQRSYMSFWIFSFRVT